MSELTFTVTAVEPFLVLTKHAAQQFRALFDTDEDGRHNPWEKDEIMRVVLAALHDDSTSLVSHAQHGKTETATFRLYTHLRIAPLLMTLDFRGQKSPDGNSDLAYVASFDDEKRSVS